MNGKQKYVIVTFYTTAEAMAAEKICKNNNIEGKLISAPRALSADCGIAWRSEIELKECMETALKEAGIEFAGIYEIAI